MVCMLAGVAWIIITLLPGLMIILTDSMGMENITAIILLRIIPKWCLKNILSTILPLMGTITRSIHAMTIRHQCG